MLLRTIKLAVKKKTCRNFNSILFSLFALSLSPLFPLCLIFYLSFFPLSDCGRTYVCLHITLEKQSVPCMQEEWRINMLPIDFLFQTVKPVIDMRVRCKSQGIEYPPEVPNDITKVVELEIVSEFSGGKKNVYLSLFYLLDY